MHGVQSTAAGCSSLLNAGWGPRSLCSSSLRTAWHVALNLAWLGCMNCAAHELMRQEACTVMLDMAPRLPCWGRMWLQGVLGSSATIRSCRDWSHGLNFFGCMACWRWGLALGVVRGGSKLTAAPATPCCMRSRISGHRLYTYAGVAVMPLSLGMRGA